MTNPFSNSSWGFPAGRDASNIALDPHLRLAAAVLANAVIDFKSYDTLIAVDALVWWLSDGALWLEELGFPSDGDSLLLAIVQRGRYYGKS